MKPVIAYFNAKPSDRKPLPRQVDAIWQALQLAPAKGVLELGAGSGALLHALAERGAQVAGIEGAPQLVELAKRRGLDVREADACRIETKPVFDGVVIMPGGILGGADEEDDLRVLRGALASLKPGGRVFIAAPHVSRAMRESSFCPMACQVVRSVRTDTETYSYKQRVYQRAELVHLLERAGAHVLEPARGPFGEPQTQPQHDHVVVIAERRDAQSPASARETWYADFFSEMEQEYLEYRFTRGTESEVETLIERLALRSGARVLDVACGVGRHALELAKRGMRVHGVDLSPSMIEVARRRAKELGVDATFEVLDAREIPASSDFDAAFTVCEGAFSLLEDDLQNRRVLEAAFGAVKPGGRFLVTALNLLRFLETGAEVDLDTGVGVWTDAPKNQPDKITQGHNRAFLYPELVSWLREAGFEVRMPETNYVFGRPIVEASHFELTLTGTKPDRERNRGGVR